MSDIIDLFAGPGGWSEGLRMLGWSELGIEWDEAACATAEAAGHKRLNADVAALEPMAFGPCWGLIASPPCQAWSMAGKGGGRRDVLKVVACLIEMAAGRDTRAETAAECEDARSVLVVEPLRWIMALKPEWIALEQVPPVLELWELYADLLRGMGYSVWCGILEAERYGVPQTRERAVLMASRVKAVQPPAPTHQRYVPKEPQRHEVTMFGEVLPWVSMAEALGWGEPTAMRANKQTNSAVREASEPAPTITGGHDTGDRVWLRAGTNANDISRPQDEPAPTIRFSARGNAVDWVSGQARNSGPGAERTPRDLTDPSYTIRSAGSGSHPAGVEWVHDRPSTTVNGDPRISEPGRHDPNESGSQQKNAVRVSVQEAAVLQSFRPDYPWQGSKTKQYEQVGNAVPPLLAAAVLRELAGEADQRAVA